MLLLTINTETKKAGCGIIPKRPDWVFLVVFTRQRIILGGMKKLTDDDIEQMLGAEFVPDDAKTRRNVRAELKLATRIPDDTSPDLTRRAVLDLHQHTEEQAWNEIMELATSGVRDATIITGASGILKIKFQQWVRDSILAPYIVSWHALNNGSFAVKFRKRRAD